MANQNNTLLFKKNITHFQGSYNVVLGQNILHNLSDLIPGPLKNSRCCIITDRTVSKLYLDKLEISLKHANIRLLKPFAAIPGERSKSFRTFQRIQSHLCSIGMSRNDFIIALGGGVIGDLAGFVASTFMRGIPFINIPTTLLSQADSSIGGKTAINHPSGKNLIGTFHFPSLVIADLQTLETLPERHISNGLAEIIKIALIADASLFYFLCKNSTSLLNVSNSIILQKILSRAIELKAAIVEEDESEKGVRMLLNFGHTFGHAIEKTVGYTKILHGQSIAAGMLAASSLAETLDICEHSFLPELKQLFVDTKLPLQIPSTDIEKLVSTMKLDKKSHSGKSRFIFPVKPGKMRIVSNIDAVLVKREFLKLIKPSKSQQS